MTVRRLPLAIGVAAFVGAALVLGGVTSLGISSGATIVVGLVALAVALGGVDRRWGGRDHETTPEPERRNHVPVPGADLTDAIDQFRSSRGGRTATSTRIVDGLRGAAVAVLTRFGGLGDDEADERIDDGTWTDDPAAAAFLSPSVERPGRSVRQRVAALLRGRSDFRQGVRRTAAAVARVGYEGLGDDASFESLPQYESEASEDVVPYTTANRVTGTVERAKRRTDHWTGIGVVALVAIGVGTLAESTPVVLAGAVGVGYAGFARATEAPTPAFELERTIGDDAPEPGDEVTVELTVENVGGGFLPDLRIVDGVPAGLAVEDGPARLGTALRPGERATIEYTVTARRGRHEFDPVLVLTRDVSRSSEREFLVSCETSIVCEPVMRPVAAPVPLRAAAATFSGRLTTREGGSGTEFHSVREYRKNDPLNRIDWNRHARTGELATLQFHEERAARVLILVDARQAAYVAPEPDGAHAVDRSVDAAARVATSLLDEGDTVGLAALGPLRRSWETVDSDVEACWLAPASGHHHRIRLQQLLATHPQFSTLPPEESSRWITQLQVIRRRLSAETQIVLFTPLGDPLSIEIARRLDSRGHPVTVVSPDSTAERTTSQQLARVGRRIRRFDLQRAGIPVVDWPAGESIDEAFARANAGDRR